MELKDFIQQFAYQFDDTSIESFEPATCFRDLEEWSSLMALSITSMIDEEYSVAINGTELKSVLTIEELFQLVASKKK